MKCPKCENTLDELDLLCGKCGALIRSEELKSFFREYKIARSADDWGECVELLQKCLALVPEKSRQHKQFEGYLKEAAHHFNNQPVLPDETKLESAENRAFSKNSFSLFKSAVSAKLIEPYEDANAALRVALASTAVILLILYLPLVASMALLAGLTKRRTLISLAVWIGSLSLLLGWKQSFAFGFMIYLHEMGHLLAIQYFGFNFAWPFFVPFIGAFVVHGAKVLKNPRKNAVISLSGPMLGAFASLAVYILKLWFDIPEFALKIAYLNLMINLFNLMPFWLLDGARIADFYSRRHLALIAGGLLAAAVFASNVFALVMFFCYAARMALHKQITRKTKKKRVQCEENLWDIAVVQTALMIVCALIARP